MVYVIIVFLAWVVFNIIFRIKVIGKENIPKEGGFIMAPNHISAIDPVFVVIGRLWGKKMLVFAKAELFEINALLSWLFHQMGAVALARGKADTDVLDVAIEECKKGRGLLIFPEGTRTKTGETGKPKSGAFVVASQAGVPMIPCRLIYDTPQGFMKLFCRVKVCYGKPIPTEELALGEVRSAAKLRACKARLSEAWDELYREHHF
ncbi:MAG: 1-acyl-sn-glycerol-3-phosphate acyltransferase [Oscillospiraceae bacterium]|nr:1-acyl-sn-glycerol-3-phosphate acyltransferase [Oscillospiraceae bacterium]